MVDEPRSVPPPPPAPSGNAPSTPTETPPSTWRRFARRWLKRLGITVVVVGLLCVALLAWAEHRTSKPEFCGSCHIMEPYYKSWHADAHGGKLEVACVDCHYAPGEQGTVKSKLRGLSQVASYVSGRYGTSRPRAHVDNRSCMTSKCHGDMQFMDKELLVGTVRFTHANHLRLYEQKQEATRRDLDELTQSLQQLVGKEHFSQLEEAAQQAIPAKLRQERLAKLAEEWSAKVDTQQLVKYSQLLDREVRLAQLADLQCTNCHSYAAPDSKPLAGKAHHFTVKTTSCYTCHFTNESFNTGTGSCLLCHSLPTKEIPVHKELSPAEGAKLQSPELAKRPVRMNHEEILKRKVNCIACHADVASENSTVTRRDCERCHDRPEYFERWRDPPSLTLVKFYHSSHVPGQRAKCLDCHSEIHHQLVQGLTEAGQPRFLSSVMSDCAHCHPNQHAEQIQLLSGAGGKGVPKADPNLMFGSRTNCFGCHTREASTAHGGVALRGAVSGCVACHGDKHAETLQKWQKTLTVLTADADEAYGQAQRQLEKAKDIAPEARRKAADLLAAARSDLNLVKRGNGVHNFMYAMDLLDSVTRRCQQAKALLTPEERPKP